ncbi:hypothetical protein M5689_006350 [Euphorbia peplus]|nr:hypothetical protein M5689_006350 [Euphorbia peplus]
MESTQISSKTGPEDASLEEGTIIYVVGSKDGVDDGGAVEASIPEAGGGFVFIFKIISSSSRTKDVLERRGHWSPHQRYSCN